jgi:hypothetical protein
VKGEGFLKKKIKKKNKNKNGYICIQGYQKKKSWRREKCPE